jgi:ketosteroid isomerase-like protein
VASAWNELEDGSAERLDPSASACTREQAHSGARVREFLVALADDESADPLALLHESYDAFARGDLDRVLELYSEDCVWDLSRQRTPSGLGAVGVGTYKGHKGLRRFFEDWMSVIAPWSRWSSPIEHAEVLNDGRVYIESQLRVWPADAPEDSAGLVVADYQQLARTRDGKITEVRNYSDRSEARRDAGLP